MGIEAPALGSRPMWRSCQPAPGAAQRPPTVNEYTVPSVSETDGAQVTGTPGRRLTFWRHVGFLSSAERPSPPQGQEDEVLSQSTCITFHRPLPLSSFDLDTPSETVQYHLPNWPEEINYLDFKSTFAHC